MAHILHDYRPWFIVLFRTMHLSCLTFRMFYSYMNAFPQNCLFIIPNYQVCHFNYHVTLFWHNKPINNMNKVVSISSCIITCLHYHGVYVPESVLPTTSIQSMLLFNMHSCVSSSAFMTLSIFIHSAFASLASMCPSY